MNTQEMIELVKNMISAETCCEDAAKAGTKLNLTLGFSHPLELEPPAGVSIEVPQPNRIVVSSISKEAVGSFAAKIRSYREPEPYKGKGIKYEGEVVRRKVGKAGAKGKK